MKIIGIGTDIVQLERIETAVNKHGKRFAERILHTNELSIYDDHSQPISYLAKRFSAKEAVSKALGTGIGKHVRLTEIETANDDQGKPVLKYYGVTQGYAEKSGVQDSFISLSDERDYALAYVMLTGK